MKEDEKGTMKRGGKEKRRRGKKVDKEVRDEKKMEMND